MDKQEDFSTQSDMPFIGEPHSIERKLGYVRMWFRRHGLELNDDQAAYMVTLCDLAVAGQLPSGFEPDWPDLDAKDDKAGRCSITFMRVLVG